MSSQLDTLSWFRANQSLLFLLNVACLAEEATNTNFIVFGLTRSGFEPMIYCTWGKHADHYTIDVVIWVDMVEPTYKDMHVLTHLVFYKIMWVCVYSVYFLVIPNPIFVIDWTLTYWSDCNVCVWLNTYILISLTVSSLFTLIELVATTERTFLRKNNFIWKSLNCKFSMIWKVK